MGHDIGILGGEVEARGRGGVDGRYLVEKVGEPHELAIVGKVEAEHRVVDRLVADVDLFEQGFLREVEQGGAQVEVFVELILQVEAEERLALH